MTSLQPVLQFPLQEAFTVSVPAEVRSADPAPARDRAVVLLLPQGPLLLAATALLGL
jgi:hypothetical protein